MKTAMNGFQGTGIWPTDPTVFIESDFLPADTTDIEQIGPSVHAVVLSAISQLESSSSASRLEKDDPSRLGDKADDGEISTQYINGTPAKKARFHEDVSATPGCSWITDKVDTATAFPVSPEILMPIPKVAGSAKRTKRKRGRTAVLTDSPYKRELEATIKEKEEKRIAKEERARMRLFKKENKNKTGKTKDKCLNKNVKTKEPKKQSKTNESDSDECSDCECLYCRKFYSKSVEGWIACSVCKKWAHNSCAGVDSEDDEAILVCELCDSD